jgi:hypothetical protein
MAPRITRRNIEGQHSRSDLSSQEVLSIVVSPSSATVRFTFLDFSAELFF